MAISHQMERLSYIWQLMGIQSKLRIHVINVEGVESGREREWEWESEGERESSREPDKGKQSTPLRTIVTHTNPPLRQTFYHLWTLLTSWMFVNNYLYVLNHHMCFDVIPIVNTLVNSTRRFRALHENRWVTLMIWQEIRWLHTLWGGGRSD